MEEMPDQWKESIIVPIHKMGDKTDCNNYRGISLLSISCKMLSIILPSRFSPYIDEIIGDHQCEFRRFSAFLKNSTPVNISFVIYRASVFNVTIEE
jgi:hypothetical protein